MHPDQLDVDVEVVRALLMPRFPAWAARPLVPVAPAGTMNAMFRLGDDLVVRVPLRGDVGDRRAELDREGAAARELAGRLPVAVPQQVAVGGGSDGTAPWSVQRWLPGAAAGLDGSVGLAADLAAVVAALRSISVGDRRFTGTYRGGELTAHDACVAECLERSANLVPTAGLRALWGRLRTLPRPAADVMSHGDLIPANLLLDGAGRLVALLDLGTVGPADPALDLVCAWHCLDAGPRRLLRDRLGCGDDEWARGQAWALEQAIGLVWYYERSNPPFSALGRSTVRRILAEPAA